MSEQKDPPRLADDEPNSPLGRALGSARGDLPTDAQLASLAERLGPTLGAPHVATSASLGVKLGVLAGIAALIATGALLARKHAASASGTQSEAAGSVALAPIASVALEPASSPAVPPSAAPSDFAQPAISAAPVAASSSSALRPSPPSEATLLEHARRALANDPASALALTNQDASLYPRGVLVQEREVIAIEALRRLHRNAEADTRAAAFAHAFPGSAHQRTVDDARAK